MRRLDPDNFFFLSPDHRMDQNQYFSPGSDPNPG